MGSYTIGKGQVVLWGHLAPHAEKMDQLLDTLEPVRRYVRSNSDTIPCFYLLKEKKADAAAVVLVFCFNSHEAYDNYLCSEAKSTLDELCTAKSLLREPQREQHLVPVAGFALRPTGLHSASGIHVAMARIDYAPGTRSEGIEHWKHVATSVEAQEKKGTHTYWFLADPENDDVLYSLERYRDEKYLWDVHVCSHPREHEEPEAYQDGVAVETLRESRIKCRPHMHEHLRVI